MWKRESQIRNKFEVSHLHNLLNKYQTLPFVNPMYIMGAKSFVGKQNWFQRNLILSLIVPNQPTDNTLWCAVLVPSYIQKGVSLTHAYVGKWNLQTISYPERNESDPWIHGETVKVCKKKKITTRQIRCNAFQLIATQQNFIAQGPFLS